MDHILIELLTEMHALAQTGLTYGESGYDRERYQRFLEISAHLGSLVGKLDYDHILNLFSQDTGYITPKIDVRGAVFQKGKILMVKETTDQLWSLPGGWADTNLSSSENVLKEIREETGFICRVIKVIGLYDKQRHNAIMWPYTYAIFFLCDMIQSPTDVIAHSFQPSLEISDIGFFECDALPPLSLERVNKKQIDRCFQHFYAMDLPTYFD